MHTMNIKDIGLSTSSFGYAMGATGKNTDRKNQDPWTLEQFIDFAATHGFGGVEAPLMRFVPDLDPERLQRLRSKLADQDMFFLMDAEVALEVGQITTLMPLAKEFGSSIIRVKSSSVLGCNRKKLGRPWTEHVEHCIAVLRELAPKLREHGLKIAIENHQDIDSNDLLQIIESVGADVVGINFDIGNAFATCEDPAVVARKWESHILNVHLKEYKILYSEDGFRLVRCPFGEGAVDFTTVLPLIAEYAPNAKLVVELGALEARNIAWRAPDFWKEIQPRAQSEQAAFTKLLEEKIIHAKDDSWQTPWEQGLSGADVTSYETRELETSINNLSTI